MIRPETRYAKSGDLRIAYQAFGKGPVDLVLAPGTVGEVEVYWEDPEFARFLSELGSLARVMMFDVRGTGLSDRPPSVATLEERVDDIRAIMDAVGSPRAALLGISEGATMTVLHAAAHPDRTAGLILCGGLARTCRAPDYPWGWDREEQERLLPSVAETWGSLSDARSFAAIAAPSRARDERFVEWVGRLERLTLSPGWATEVERMLLQVDIRSVLPSIQAPTLVLHSRGDDVVKVEHGRYLAEHIPNAKLIELPGADHLFWFHPEARAIGLREMRTFLEALEPQSASDRVLATVVFTDIVGSTRRATELGDHAWSGLLSQHFRMVRAELARFRGREVKATGDGLLATFDGPTRALRFADAVRAGGRQLGLDLRVGIHTGECAFKGGDVEGIAVHIAARITDRAGPGEVLVSSTVRDLSVGSGLPLTGRGTYALKGVSDRWRLFALESAFAAAPTRNSDRGS